MAAKCELAISISEARRILGASAKKYSDDDINRLLVQFSDLTTVILDQIRFQNKASCDINVDYKSQL